ncbi:zinc finger protein [Ciona intestinalis]
MLRTTHVESSMDNLATTVDAVNGINDETVGYDYEFIPSLDNKYMCPICLLALRDPVQTECGHRFCHLCILRCIRSKASCPVDQRTLFSNQLFQDRSAHREVLDLKAKCPNIGCNLVVELRNIKDHITKCPHRRTPCKNGCGLELLEQDLVHHETSQCPQRPVTCPTCQHKYASSAEKEHKEECKQYEPVSCEHCNHEVKRYKLKQHMSSECPQAPIKCVFDKVGCHQQYPRHDIKTHMENTTQIHLQYLLSFIMNLQKQNDELQESLKVAKLKLDKTTARENDSAEPTVSDRLRFESVNISDGNIYSPNHDAASENDEIDEIDRIKVENKRREEAMVSSASSSSASSPLVGATGEPLNNHLHLTMMANKQTDQDGKIVRLDHHVRELMAKMETQILQIKDIQNRLTGVEQRIDNQELRCCNGLYYWKIKDYAQLRRAACLGEMPVLHSPGFYTSPQGYRMCIRANLDGVESAQGTHLSLFVHLMKGDFDDVLPWPFCGSITLTVINQKELPSQRAHVSEMLESRANLMAFQRPVTERNQKGYGYIDFLPLNLIETEGFIKSDTLVIKAQVHVFELSLQ